MKLTSELNYVGYQKKGRWKDCIISNSFFDNSSIETVGNFTDRRTTINLNLSQSHIIIILVNRLL